ncbi:MULTISPECIES: hypothetical protein [Streptomyces]|uniref:hypothetical protein n=1 Tax=Streptomyces TaxID=1883 RepID=UPI0006EBB203|nr:MULTISPECIES: hypothetical protein [Streptomyces]
MRRRRGSGRRESAGRGRIRRAASVVAVLAAAAPAALVPLPAQANGGPSAVGSTLVRTDTGWLRGESTAEGRHTEHASPTHAYGAALGDRAFACPTLRLNNALAARGCGEVRSANS